MPFAPNDFCLRAIDGPEAKLIYPLAEHCRAGRHPDSEILISSLVVGRIAFFLIWDPEERRHFIDQAWCGHTPVSVNGRTVQPQECFHLQPEDRITIADVTLSYEHSPSSMTTMLANVEQRGDDTHADLVVRQEWIDMRQFVVAEHSHGGKIDLKLAENMEDGMSLRLAGQALHGTGNLLLRICIVK